MGFLFDCKTSRNLRKPSFEALAVAALLCKYDGRGRRWRCCDTRHARHSTTAPQHHSTTAAAALSAGNTGHWSDVVTRFRSLHHDAQCAVHITGGSLTFHCLCMYCTFFYHFTFKIMQPILPFLAKLQVLGLHAALSCLILQSFMQKLKKHAKTKSFYCCL